MAEFCTGVVTNLRKTEENKVIVLVNYLHIESLEYETVEWVDLNGFSVVQNDLVKVQWRDETTSKNFKVLNKIIWVYSSSNPIQPNLTTSKQLHLQSQEFPV